MHFVPLIWFYLRTSDSIKYARKLESYKGFFKKLYISTSIKATIFLIRISLMQTSYQISVAASFTSRAQRLGPDWLRYLWKEVLKSLHNFWTNSFLDAWLKPYLWFQIKRWTSNLVTFLISIQAGFEMYRDGEDVVITEDYLIAGVLRQKIQGKVWHLNPTT